MNLKKLANTLLIAGAVCLVAGPVLGGLIPTAWVTSTPQPISLVVSFISVILIYAPFISGPIFLLGLILRLFVRSGEPSTLQQGVITQTESGQKEYSFWRTMLIVGLVLWLPAAAMVALGTGLIEAGAGEAAEIYRQYSSILTDAVLLAVPLSIAALALGIYFRRNGRLRAAIQTLRVPFYYLLLVIGIGIYLDYLG